MVVLTILLLLLLGCPGPHGPQDQNVRTELGARLNHSPGPVVGGGQLHHVNVNVGAQAVLGGVCHLKWVEDREGWDTTDTLYRMSVARG